MRLSCKLCYSDAVPWSSVILHNRIILGHRDGRLNFLERITSTLSTLHYHNSGVVFLDKLDHRYNPPSLSLFLSLTHSLSPSISLCLSLSLHLTHTLSLKHTYLHIWQLPANIWLTFSTIIIMLVMKLTVTQNDVAFTYHKVCGLHVMATIFLAFLVPLLSIMKKAP